MYDKSAGVCILFVCQSWWIVGQWTPWYDLPIVLDSRVYSWNAVSIHIFILLNFIVIHIK